MKVKGEESVQSSSTRKGRERLSSRSVAFGSHNCDGLCVSTRGTGGLRGLRGLRGPRLRSTAQQLRLSRYALGGVG